VKEGDYKKQQQLAMTLYKTFAAQKYYFWSVVSMVLQVRTAGRAGTVRAVGPVA
jgi:hypothetical protein